MEEKYGCEYCVEGRKVVKDTDMERSMWCGKEKCRYSEVLDEYPNYRAYERTTSNGLSLKELLGMTNDK